MNPINDYEINSGLNRSIRYTDSPQAQRWAKTVWRNWLLRQPEFVCAVPTVIGPAARITSQVSYTFNRGRQNTIPLDEVLTHAQQHKLGYIYELDISGNWCMMYAPWQWRLLAAPTVDWWRIDSREALRGILDWMHAEPTALPKDLSRLSADQAQEQSFDWHHRMNVRSAAKEADVGERVEIAPGIYQLCDEQALWHEGHHMHHCVGAYWSRVQSKSTTIYHVDDPKATVELVAGRVVQFRGVCNANVQLKPETLDIITKHGILNHEKTRVQSSLPSWQQATYPGDLRQRITLP